MSSLTVEEISSIDDGKLRYDMFVKAYNETREHGGINGLTPSERFLQRLIKSKTNKKEARKCNLCRYLKVSPVYVSATIKWL